MTPDEARTVLAAAESATTRYEWGEVLHLLEPVYGAGILQGAEHGRVAYFIGLATLWGSDAATAEPYLREAVATGDAATRELAEELLSRSLHEQVADLAIQDHGGIGADEAPTVLATADELLRANDWDHAQHYYTSLYNGRQVPDAYRYAGALGIGRCEAARGNYDQAVPYLQYVVDNDANLAATATSQLQEIERQKSALTAAADGGDAGEFKELKAAAVVAASAHDYETAYRFYEAIANGPSFSVVDRAWGRFGMGFVEWTRGNLDEARADLRLAERDGNPVTVGRVQRMLGAIDRAEQADHLVAELLAGD